MGGGAWPFLVGGVICLVNSVNERDLNLLNSCANSVLPSHFGFGQSGEWNRQRLQGLLRGTLRIYSEWKFEAKTGL